MNEAEQSDREHLVRLRIALQILGGVIPHGALESADMATVTRPIAALIYTLEGALEEPQDTVMTMTPEEEAIAIIQGALLAGGHRSAGGVVVTPKEAANIVCRLISDKLKRIDGLKR